MVNAFAILALAASASATASFHSKAPPFTCPSTSPDKCCQQQGNGWSFDDISYGPLSSYSGFNFEGFTCDSSGNNYKRGLTGRDNGKFIRGVTSADKSSCPTISCDEDNVKSFSIDKIHIGVEYDCDLEFHYGMSDGSTCKQTSSCSRSGSVVENTQCGGAKNVTVVQPKPPAGKSHCSISVSSVAFHCSTTTTIPHLSTSCTNKPPPRTTTHRATTTHTTSVHHTTSTSVVVPPTSSSVVVPPTTSSASTSSSVVVPPTTSSAATSSSVVVPPTTSSTSTSSYVVVPPTSSSVVVPPTTSSAAASSSVVVPSSSSSVVVPPTSSSVVVPPTTSSAAASSSVVVPPTSSSVVPPTTSSAAASSSVVVPPTSSSVVVPPTTSSVVVPNNSTYVIPTPSSSSPALSTSVVVSPTTSSAAGSSSVVVPPPTSSAAASTSPVYSSSAIISYSTSTVRTTVVQTITSCAPTVTDCPARTSPVVTTVTIDVSTTICPVTATEVPGTTTVASPGTAPYSAPVSTPTPACPDVLPSCLNTWIPLLTTCLDNTDSACYCPSSSLTTNVYECLNAHGADAAEISAAQTFFQGICAPYVSGNPGIVTGVTAAGTYPAPVITGPATTLVVIATITIPYTDVSGSAVPGSSVVSVYTTSAVVPAVVFTTVGSSAALVPGTAAPAVPYSTLAPVASTYVSGYGATPTGASSPAFTGAASHVVGAGALGFAGLMVALVL